MEHSAAIKEFDNYRYLVGYYIHKYIDSENNDLLYRLNFFTIREQIKLLKNALDTNTELDLSMDFILNALKRDNQSTMA